MNIHDNNSCYLLPDEIKNDLPEAHEKFRRSITIILENKSEYNRLTELLDTVMYQAKLMSCYGLDTKNGKWNITQYPITQTDRQVAGISSDIQEYNDTINQYNEYARHLGLAYGIDINREMKKGCKIIFRSPESNRTDEK
ncbi:hypothetical protein BH23THE1_BH23THE1_07910 [soil metagenome]